jgi:hypothetical protein
VDLVGPVHDAQLTGDRVERRERRVHGQPRGAEDLDRPVDDRGRGPGGHHLDPGDLGPGRAADIVIAGGTHGEAGALALDSPGERTAVFSSPQAIPDLAHEWGWALLDQRFRAALESFATRAASWLVIRRHRGLEDAAALYQRVLANADSPAEAHLIKL